jgi:hypothetical protein
MNKVADAFIAECLGILLNFLIPFRDPWQEMLINKPPYIFFHFPAAGIIVKMQAFVNQGGKEKEFDAKVIIRSCDVMA